MSRNIEAVASTNNYGDNSYGGLWGSGYLTCTTAAILVHVVFGSPGRGGVSQDGITDKAIQPGQSMNFEAPPGRFLQLVEFKSAVAGTPGTVSGYFAGENDLVITASDSGQVPPKSGAIFFNDPNTSLALRWLEITVDNTDSNGFGAYINDTSNGGVVFANDGTVVLKLGGSGGSPWVDVTTLGTDPGGYGQHYKDSSGGGIALETTGAGVVKTIATPIALGGITGAVSASRWVGATVSGHPTSGSFVVGDFVIDRTGKIWICTTAGTPGTWTNVSVTVVTSADGSVHVVGGTDLSLATTAATAGISLHDTSAGGVGIVLNSDNGPIQIEVGGSGYVQLTGLDNYVTVEHGLGITAQVQSGVSFSVLNHSGSARIQMLDGSGGADKIGLYGATAVAQPAAIPPPAGGATIDTQARIAINAILNAIGAAAGGIGVTA